MAQGQLYCGRVKSFNQQKGYGFISCPETQQTYGKDIFVLKTSLPGASAEPGDEVAFTVKQEHNGPVAADVQLLRRVEGGGCGGGAVAAAHRSGLEYGGLEYRGVVKSFNIENGWGMIECAATHQAFGKDVFFSKAVLPSGYISQGAQVGFSIKMEAKGPAVAALQVLAGGAARPPNPLPRPLQGLQWQGPPYHTPLARERQRAVMQPPALAYQAPPPPSPAVGRQFLGGMAYQGSGLPAAYQALAAPAPAAAGGGRIPESFFGVLKTWSEEKGWGHINCEVANRLYGKDVFLMRSVLNGQPVEPGALISFKVNAGAKGPQAASVSVLPPGSFCLNGEPSNTFTGVVKSFNVDKGWGFISSDELRRVFGKDIFVHKRELEGQSPSVGDELFFRVSLDDQGQPVAKCGGALQAAAPGEANFLALMGGEPQPPLRGAAAAAAARSAPY